LTRKQLHFVQSLGRGLAVLQAFSAESPSLKLSEIAQITGLNVTAAQRFTDTLMQLGFIHRDKHREFHLTPKVLSLGFAFLNGSQLKRLGADLMDRCSQRLNRTMNLAALDGDAVVFLHRSETQRFLKFDLQAGSRLPSHSTGTGKALLAGLEDAELFRKLENMELTQVTSYTLTTPRALWEDLMEIRKRGYSICDREMNLSLYSLGAPVLNGEGKTVAAINISLSVEEAKSDLPRKMLEELWALSREISLSLGWDGAYPAYPPPAPWPSQEK